jgi:flagellar hook protein FlgE
MQIGYGLNTTGTSLNFSQGELRQTGNDLDFAINGQGLFTLRDDAGNLHYTRAGQFMFNTDGVLVSRTDGSKVMGIDANGVMGEITIAGKQTSDAKATANVIFNGNLSSTSDTQTINSVKVIDSVGGEHLLTVKLTKNVTIPADPNDPNSVPIDPVPGSWTVELDDGATVVGTAQLVFTDGRPDPAQSKLSFNYAPAGVPAVPLVLDFSTNVTSFASGNLSTLAFASQDGYGPGALTTVTVDSTGTLVMTYSNGQTVKGSKLALGRFDSLDAVESVGGNSFIDTNSLAWHMGSAGDGGFGSVRSGMVELSNVDLSQEFSDLVIMQRGYQASSQVISTANEMLQELFNMKGGR